ncbi:MAG: hypothetical protein J0M12_13840 [Deltaproteobacteria bacterium]|nr:hypothetical protein [Deltaproteobacteria bacterium]
MSASATADRDTRDSRREREKAPEPTPAEQIKKQIDDIVAFASKEGGTAVKAIADRMQIEMAAQRVDDPRLAPATQQGVLAFLKSTFVCFQGMAAGQSKLDEMSNALYPSERQLQNLGDAADGSIKVARDGKVALDAALQNLRTLTPPIEMRGFKSVSESVNQALDLLERHKKATIESIQDETLDRRKGPASDPRFAQIFDDTQADVAAISVGSLSTATGPASMELFKQEGLVYARFKIPGSSGVPTEVEYRLDSESAWRDATAPDQEGLIARSEQTNARILGRLDAILHTWDQLGAATTLPAQRDEISAGSGYGLVAGSELARTLLSEGAKITRLANGGFVDTNVVGLDLSGATLDNFDIKSCWAHNICLADTKLINGSQIIDNDMNNANCSGMRFEKSAGKQSLFCRNDMHGTSGSLMNAQFANIDCQNNNLLGVNMSGIRSDYIVAIAADKGGVPFIGAVSRAKGDFKNQFKGSSFLPNQFLTDSFASSVFTANSTPTKNGTKLQEKVKDLSSENMRDILASAPFNIGLPTVVPANPAGGIFVSGTSYSTTSLDGSKSLEFHLEDNMRRGIVLGGDDSVRKGAMGNLELMTQLLSIASKNRKADVAPGSGSMMAAPTSTYFEV